MSVIKTFPLAFASGYAAPCTIIKSLTLMRRPSFPHLLLRPLQPVVCFLHRTLYKNTVQKHLRNCTALKIETDRPEWPPLITCDFALHLETMPWGVFPLGELRWWRAGGVRRWPDIAVRAARAEQKQHPLVTRSGPREWGSEGVGGVEGGVQWRNMTHWGESEGLSVPLCDI
jgi:hypothetical protein